MRETRITSRSTKRTYVYTSTHLAFALSHTIILFYLYFALFSTPAPRLSERARARAGICIWIFPFNTVQTNTIFIIPSNPFLCSMIFYHIRPISCFVSLSLYAEIPTASLRLFLYFLIHFLAYTCMHVQHVRTKYEA